MKRFLALSILTVLLMVAVADASAEIKIGVLAFRGTEEAQRRWVPLGEHLTQVMGQKVTFEPVLHHNIVEFGKAHTDQFLMVNPWQFLKIKSRFDATPILSLDEQEFGTAFGGVIFARKDSGITKIGDLKDKSLMCVKFNGAGGRLFQKAVMLKSGVHPERECKSLSEAGSQDAVVAAVRDGKADVGTVRTGILESLHAQGKINMNDFIVINPVRHEGLNCAASTPLYPSWPLSALRHTKPAVAASLKDALLAIPAEHPALKNAKLNRFIEPMDYQPMSNLSEFLRSAGHALVGGN